MHHIERLDKENYTQLTELVNQSYPDKDVHRVPNVSNKQFSYNNLGPAPSFIVDVQQHTQKDLLQAKEYFSGACHTCGAMPAVTGTPVLCCAGCQLVSYCNKNCQRADWKVHKIICKKFPVEMGKNIIVRKTESVRTGYESFLFATMKIIESFNKSEGTQNQYTYSVQRILLNPRVCNICREARNQKLFDCRCCSVSYCSESHRMKDTEHLSEECDVLYGRAIANWYLTKHRQLLIPDGLLNEVNLNDGIIFEKVSKLSKYSSENWLEAIVHLINVRLTFPLTIHNVLRNLKLGKQRKCFTDITSLTIHIVHKTPMLDHRMWEFLLHQLPNLKILNLTFINRRIKLNNPYNTNLPVERCSDCKRKQRVINYNFHPINYHEYFSSDDYVEPDVVAVFGSTIDMITGQNLTGENFDKAERFTSQGNMTYNKHTVVILTDADKYMLEDCVKSFHDARPITLLLPVQENPVGRFSIIFANNEVLNNYSYLCCLQGKHRNC